ncbi:hypothetical protein BJ508DRAFT_332378 [Ascobolus immersus RN42]|uniref:Uncharacterized protein n=1 Tax=Ascobolus immersus RN42 TaxID=1160509 RepID=A0A3N4HZV8_ASCIM|nr:hypothetical protein BJ508DRAFT_332378 [Ascobolus immersus RN42]
MSNPNLPGSNKRDSEGPHGDSASPGPNLLPSPLVVPHRGITPTEEILEDMAFNLIKYGTRTGAEIAGSTLQNEQPEASTEQAEHPDSNLLLDDTGKLPSGYSVFTHNPKNLGSHLILCHMDDLRALLDVATGVEKFTVQETVLIAVYRAKSSIDVLCICGGIMLWASFESTHSASCTGYPPGQVEVAPGDEDKKHKAKEKNFSVSQGFKMPFITVTTSFQHNKDNMKYFVHLESSALLTTRTPRYDTWFSIRSFIQQYAHTTAPLYDLRFIARSSYSVSNSNRETGPYARPGADPSRKRPSRNVHVPVRKRTGDDAGLPAPVPAGNDPFVHQVQGLTSTGTGQYSTGPGLGFDQAGFGYHTNQLTGTQSFVNSGQGLPTEMGQPVLQQYAHQPTDPTQALGNQQYLSLGQGQATAVPGQYDFPTLQGMGYNLVPYSGHYPGDPNMYPEPQEDIFQSQQVQQFVPDPSFNHQGVIATHFDQFQTAQDFGYGLSAGQLYTQTPYSGHYPGAGNNDPSTYGSGVAAQGTMVSMPQLAFPSDLDTSMRAGSNFTQRHIKLEEESQSDAGNQD